MWLVKCDSLITMKNVFEIQNRVSECLDIILTCVLMLILTLKMSWVDYLY